MLEEPNTMPAIRRDRRVHPAAVAAATPTTAKPRIFPTLVLFSADREVVSLAKRAIQAPWRIELCEDPTIAHEALSHPLVRLVIVDDSVVDEQARGWLLDRIRKFAPQAMIIYIAGAHSEADERRARGHSAQYYTAKPLDLDRTTRVIRSFGRAALARDRASWQ